MKKIYLVLLVVMTIGSDLLLPKTVKAGEIKGQKDTSMYFAIGVLWGSENLGFFLSEHFNVPVFVQFECTKDAEIGLVAGYDKAIKDYLNLTIAGEFQYRLKMDMSDNHPTSQTFSNPDRMVVSLRIGPTLRIWRVYLGVYYNLGQSFVPSSRSSIQDWRWYQGGAIKLSLKLF